MSHCKNCEAPTTLVICWACVRLLRRQLAELPWYLNSLRESAYGQAQLKSRDAVRSVSCDTPSLPLNSRASGLLQTATVWLDDHARNLLPDTARGLRAGGLAHALSQLTSELMAYPFAADLLRAVVDLRARCEEVIDLPLERTLAGLCAEDVVREDGSTERCATAVYVDRDATERLAVCPRCGGICDIEELRAQGLAHIYNELRSAADMFRICKWLGREVSRATFYRVIAKVEPRELGGEVVLYAWPDVEAALDEADRRRELLRAWREAHAEHHLLTQQQATG